MGDAPSEEQLSAIIDRLVRAVNDCDLEALVACFDADYVNETPAHPERSFRGSEQVRRNWTQILGYVPDLRADVLQTAVTGDRVWTEWEMDGTRHDGERFQMAGVVIFGIGGGTIKSARFYLEPVEKATGDADAAIDRLTASERVK
jgi:ketosteroid isomerase-like protein